MLMKDSGFATKLFNTNEIAKIWSVLHRHTVDADGEKNTLEWSILFPKFLEGLVRATTRRYRPKVEEAPAVEQTPKRGSPRMRAPQHKGPRPPDIHERMLYAFQEHVLSNSKANAAIGIQKMNGLTVGTGPASAAPQSSVKSIFSSRGKGGVRAKKSKGKDKGSKSM